MEQQTPSQIVLASSLQAQVRQCDTLTIELDYRGSMQLGDAPAEDIWNLMGPLEINGLIHPSGSTLCRTTLEKYGFRLPEHSRCVVGSRIHVHRNADKHFTAQAM